MERKMLLIDPDLCYGCFSCEVACKQEHNLPSPGPRLIQVVRIGPFRQNGRLRMEFHPQRCMHCMKAACMEVCPRGAVQRTLDGRVVVDENLCDGCTLCIEACPINTPQLNPLTGTVQMCDLCVNRTARGLMPACVHHCPTRALFYGTPKEFMLQRTHAHRLK